jgi:hypothetical protein
MTNPWDELSKALASGVSRRKALWMFGSALVGTIVMRGKALADGGSNSACAHFCAAVFGADTPAAAQCASDAAHMTGLCYSCGPAAGSNSVPPQYICCNGEFLDSNGFCPSYSAATCPMSVSGVLVCS